MIDAMLQKTLTNPGNSIGCDFNFWPHFLRTMSMVYCNISGEDSKLGWATALAHLIPREPLRTWAKESIVSNDAPPRSNLPDAGARSRDSVMLRHLGLLILSQIPNHGDYTQTRAGIMLTEITRILSEQTIVDAEMNGWATLINAVENSQLVGDQSLDIFMYLVASHTGVAHHMHMVCGMSRIASVANTTVPSLKSRARESRDACYTLGFTVRVDCQELYTLGAAEFRMEINAIAGLLLTVVRGMMLTWRTFSPERTPEAKHASALGLLIGVSAWRPDPRQT